MELHHIIFIASSLAIGATNPASCTVIDKHKVIRPQSADCDVGSLL
jgi:hypothetical protein